VKFVDLFAGMGGFHRALSSLGHECVFASELDEELRALYARNFRGAASIIHGDIRISKAKVPPHDLLCAGFPCQPFSKSGFQSGTRDLTRGTLFNEILVILRKHRPKYVLLENVGNFERHNAGRTWAIVRESLVALGYSVLGTTHIASGGHGLISPHHLGYPHTRERFFIVATLDVLEEDPFPTRDRLQRTSVRSILQTQRELTKLDLVETAISPHHIGCIEHWNRFLRALPPSHQLPSFPIWGDELGATYPFEETTPSMLSERALMRHVTLNGGPRPQTKEDLLGLLPSYARTEQERFPAWKQAFIRKNRAWFRDIERHLSNKWVGNLRELPPSLRKLEWNCQGEERDLWKHILQFRPSGLRAKRIVSSPALVAMTESQIPIVGPKRRYFSRVEGLRLQGFPDSHWLPVRRDRAFAALGNAVHVQVVRAIGERFLPSD
jgi:DNA (cytosine-5)-methyltransferase 1